MSERHLTDEDLKLIIDTLPLIGAALQNIMNAITANIHAMAAAIDQLPPDVKEEMRRRVG